MLKTIIISAIATALCLTALFAGAASATGYLRRAVAVNVPTTPLATEIAGDCVVQTRWVKSAGQMVQVERPVCY